MIPPVYHSLRRESIKNASSASEIGVQSVHPAWLKTSRCPKDLDLQRTKGSPNRCMALNWLSKKRALPLKEQPEFPALALLASRGLLAPDAWKCKRAQVNLKATIDVPMLAQWSNKMAMGFWKIPTCQWDGRYTLMVPSDNVAFIDLQPYKSSTTCWENTTWKEIQ